jgi:hypothetical protein
MQEAEFSYIWSPGGRWEKKVMLTASWKNPGEDHYEKFFIILLYNFHDFTLSPTAQI